MASPNFSLSQMVVANNTAYLGGGLFVGADLADNVSISGMQFTGNSALLGRHTPSLHLHMSCLYAEQGCEEAAAALGPCSSSEACYLGCILLVCVCVCSNHDACEGQHGNLQAMPPVPCFLLCGWGTSHAHVLAEKSPSIAAVGHHARQAVL